VSPGNRCHDAHVHVHRQESRQVRGVEIRQAHMDNVGLSLQSLCHTYQFLGKSRPSSTSLACTLQQALFLVFRAIPFSVKSFFFHVGHMWTSVRRLNAWQ
jgi:hypothetical protein